MRAAYIRLHELGYAHSVEVYLDGKLSGGLYGVSLGACFFGESMFSLAPNTSKAALIALTKYLLDKSFIIIDCQVYTQHLATMGAVDIPRQDFLEILLEGLQHKTYKGNWGGLFENFPDSEYFINLKKT